MMEPPKGILFVDKPTGMTSHSLVVKIRKVIRLPKPHPKIKVGHTGTLDYAASGLMLLTVGKATKSTAFFQGLDKEYLATVKLGQVTDTYDREGTIIAEKEVTSTVEEVRAAAATFAKIYDQMPPPYSAKKIGGKKAYKLAQKGKEVKLNPKRITIYEIEVTDIDLPLVTLRVVCSSGTYIRSLAVELGEQLGCGGHIYALRRTKVDDFSIDEAHSLDDLLDMERDEVVALVRPLDEVKNRVSRPGEDTI